MNAIEARAQRDSTFLAGELPRAPHDAVAARARFFNSGNAFNKKLPNVPAAIFVDEFARAVAARTTAAIACDQSAALGTPFAATTPLMLARYVAIAPGDTLTQTFIATGCIWYVIDGSGSAAVDGESFGWDRGDVFVTPGGVPIALSAASSGAVLWLVTNEPQLAFDGLTPRAEPATRVECVHYPAAEIAHQLETVVSAQRAADTAGIALIFSTARAEASRNVLPSLTLSLNTVPAGERQRAHRHNSAAITLILRGEHCYSLVGERRCDWSRHATLVTPPTEPHSHHNAGHERAMFLIVQDGGLHDHARTMGFAFLEAGD